MRRVQLENFIRGWVAAKPNERNEKERRRRDRFLAQGVSPGKKDLLRRTWGLRPRLTICRRTAARSRATALGRGSTLDESRSTPCRAARRSRFPVRPGRCPSD
jgi:hypothetical protein